MLMLLLVVIWILKNSLNRVDAGSTAFPLVAWILFRSHGICVPYIALLLLLLFLRWAAHWSIIIKKNATWWNWISFHTCFWILMLHVRLIFCVSGSVDIRPLVYSVSCFSLVVNRRFTFTCSLQALGTYVSRTLRTVLNWVVVGSFSATTIV